MPRLDWELTARQLLKRMSKWKDATLIQRLKDLDFTHYSPKFEAKIRAGQYTIPHKTRVKLEKKYLNLATKHGKQLKKPAPVSAAPTLTGTWYTLDHWLKRYAKKHPEFNLEFSKIKLENRDFHFVWVRGSKIVFTDKKKDGAPTGIPNQGIYGIYQVGITIIDLKTYDETFLQASHTIVYGPDPLNDRVWKEVENEISVFEDRNREAMNTYNRKQLAYRWNDEAHEGSITFMGIGVKL